MHGGFLPQMRVTPEEVRTALLEWQGDEAARGLPTAPVRPIEVAARS